MKKSASPLAWSLIGIIILLIPIGHFRWMGTVPILVSFLYWKFFLRQRWVYVIKIKDDHLRIENKSYAWKDIDQLEFDRTGGRHHIRVSGNKGKINLLIKDDLPGFRELTQECLFHMSATSEAPIKSQDRDL